jgi:hypothetical protein
MNLALGTLGRSRALVECPGTGRIPCYTRALLNRPSASSGQRLSCSLRGHKGWTEPFGFTRRVSAMVIPPVNNAIERSKGD